MTINDPIPSGVLLVDLRDAKDYCAGHIPGAARLTLPEIMKKAEKDDVILLYCYRGKRSAMTARILRLLGYRRAHSVGGIDQYKGMLIH